MGGKVSSRPPRSVSFRAEKLMIPLFWHNMGNETAVCALIDLIRSGFGHRMPAMDDTKS